MLDFRLIRRLFRALNGELKKADVQGEVGLCDGAVMCLVFEARKATKDVDAIFRPTREIRAAARTVAKKFDLPEDWLNDAAKGFFTAGPPREDVLNLSHLRVWAPSADYMLAMKCVSARFDSQDADDAAFLVRWLNLKSPAEVFSLIERYYPREKVPPKTQFYVEEMFEVSTARSRNRFPLKRPGSEAGPRAGVPRGIIGKQPPKPRRPEAAYKTKPSKSSGVMSEKALRGYSSHLAGRLAGRFAAPHLNS